jgi:hypothetical protein
MKKHDEESTLALNKQPGPFPHKLEPATVPVDETGDCPQRTAWLEELTAKYRAKYGRNCPE